MSSDSESTPREVDAKPAPAQAASSSASTSTDSGSLLTNVFAGAAPTVEKPVVVPMLSGPGSVAAPRPAAVVGTDGDTLEGSAAANEDVEVLQYKVAVVGNGAVGKTTLISRLCTPDFTPQYKQTLGVDLYKKRIDLPDGVKASLQIWDIGGQTLNAPMLSHYLYAAQAIIFVYDVTNPASFKDLEDWLAKVQSLFQPSEMPYLALVGNKMDLTHIRAVKAEKHAKFADANNMFSFLLSVRLGDLVEVMFRRIAADLAGVVLTKAHLDVAPTAIPARLTNHPQHDPAQKPLQLRDQKKSSACVIQ